MAEWDEAKNILNIAKHGVDFALAQQIFNGLVLTIIDARRDYGEQREISIGAVDKILILTVVHTDRAGVKRLISARRASQKEKRLYEEALR